MSGGNIGYVVFFFQAEDGIRDPLWSRGLGDVYKRRKRGYFFGQNSIFEAVFYVFFKKIELFRRKTVRINIFPGGKKNSATIGKKKGQSDFAPKRVKRGTFFGQNSVFELVFTFFQKDPVVSQKDSSNKHIP